jgi:hypothetical protein
VSFVGDRAGTRVASMIRRILVRRFLLHNGPAGCDTTADDAKAAHDSGADRRSVDIDRPGKKDRRRAVDPRKPDVVELEMTNSEWTALNQSPAPPTKAG